MENGPKLDPVVLVAEELSLPEASVRAVVALLDDGNTIPFVARYRKEKTGGLDEVAIRDIEDRMRYLRELEERREAILASIEEQGALEEALRRRILAARTKAELEDLYLPYKPKRRTRATLARERGLAPLADRILEQPASGDPAGEAAAFVDVEKGVESTDDALAGARDIVAEATAENATVRAFVRETFAREARLRSTVTPEHEGRKTKFEAYHDHLEPLAAMPSHRYLAIRRGEREGVLRVAVELDVEPVLDRIRREMGHDPASPFAAPLAEAVEDAFGRLIAPAVTNDVRADVKARSDLAAVEVFAENLRHLLLAAPFGSRAVIGIDPGLRTGCKCAVVDTTGKFLEHRTIFPSRGAAAEKEAGEILLDLVRRHDPAAIAVGNGTGGRETETFVRRTLRAAGAEEAIVVSVNESGASVYSASDLARQEFPELDLTIRGAISIARRLQDPLAELVKIDPKAIGVGQYQHDVHQPLLKRKLDEVVESCVNGVGVELNTASGPLLAHVAGIGPKVARNIVSHRESTGGFRSRRDLLDVSGLGPKAFEQSAGFLRVRGGAHPLDASAVHPERYALVERMAADLGVNVAELVGNAKLVGSIDVGAYVDETVGEPTLRDILAELEKPGRDPRDAFEPPRFRDDVLVPADLQPGMELEGVVTNVTDFGAFVDVGVHQDGLVHVSQLSDSFVKSPADVVKTGDKIRVRVLEVDLERNRISLTARKDADPKARAKRGGPRASHGKATAGGASSGRGAAASSDGAGKRKAARAKAKRPPAGGGRTGSGGARKGAASEGNRPPKRGKKPAPRAEAGPAADAASFEDKLAALKRKFNSR